MPNITNCPDDASVNTTFREPTGIFSYPMPVCVDNGGPTTVTTSKFDTEYDIGPTTVIIACFDESGNIERCTFVVTVTGTSFQSRLQP